MGFHLCASSQPFLLQQMTHKTVPKPLNDRKQKYSSSLTSWKLPATDKKSPKLRRSKQNQAHSKTKTLLSCQCSNMNYRGGTQP